jgi:uncharacterized membrane protein YhaH (DUF805 family)
MHWMFLPLRRYARISGRATRREFWLFHMLFYGVLISYFLIIPLLARSWQSQAGLIVIAILAIGYFVAFLAMLIPSLCVSIRRLHDHDKPGWFYLLSFIPLVGWIFWLLMMLTPGTQGANSYGDDPREAPLDRIAGVFS